MVQGIAIKKNNISGKNKHSSFLPPPFNCHYAKYNWTNESKKEIKHKT